MVGSQCRWCGAPLRGEHHVACSFCGTMPEPASPPVVSGPALCVCSVMATWRCNVCDSPVCHQHRNRFWPGQGRGNLRLATEFEWTVWDDAANATPPPNNGQNVEWCTGCRARSAAANLDRYRSIRWQSHTTPFMFMLALARARVFSPRSFTGMSASQFIADLANEHLRLRWNPQPVATTWSEIAGRTAKAKQPHNCFMFRTSHGTTLLALASNLSVCGPVTLRTGTPLTAPVANSRDAVCVSRPPLDADPRVATHRYTIRWRPAGNTVQDLGLNSYADLLSPLA